MKGAVVDAVFVRLEGGHQGASTRDFMRWVIDQEDMAPLRGTLSSGPGFFQAVFEVRHKDAILAKLRELGLEIEP